MNYRLYIDESGTHNYSNIEKISNQYLGLTGIIVEQNDNELILQPKIRNLKKLFTDDPDIMPCLHREDIVNKNGPFTKLSNADTSIEFNSQYFEILEKLPFKICAIVIDKKSHHDRYQESAMHPYHYCLTVMLERYAHFLKSHGRGDVMAEARGGEEDMTLKSVYNQFYLNGTAYRSREYVQSVLTSRELKLKTKEHHIAGLELADLLSLPTKLDTLHSYDILPTLSENFTLKVMSIIQPKYITGGYPNKILGYGKKMLK